MSVRHAVLGLLAEQPDHGYRIKQRFEQRVGQVWGLNLGQVYQVLASLESSGLVRKLEGGDSHEHCDEQPTAKERQQFQLTEKGERALQMWLQRTPSTPKPMRDELLVRLLLLGKGQPEQAIARIDAQQRIYTRYLAKLRARERKLLKQTGDDTLSAVLGLDAARLHAEAHIKWLENCRMRFKEQIVPAHKRGLSSAPSVDPFADRDDFDDTAAAAERDE